MVLPYRDEITASGNFLYFGDAPPTSGDFFLGDILVVVPTSTAPTIGPAYPMMYRCTTASVAHNGGTWTASSIGSSYSATIIAAAATIAPTAFVFHVSGTASAISTITPPAGLQAGQSLSLIPDSAWSTNTSGNIKIASTGVPGKILIETWDGTSFYPSY